MDHPLLAKVYDELHRTLTTENPSLNRMMEYLVTAKGKGIRPLLILLCGDIVSAPVKQSVDLAVAVELLHMASLVHDDVVDQADFRRNQLTAHKMWGKRSAVLLGDFFFGKMLKTISFYPSVISLFANAVQSMVKGELLQEEQQFKYWLPEEEYLKRIYHKTSFLMETCCKINCFTGEIPTEIIDALSKFGYHYGIAYQLLDDLQDILENPFSIGKPVGQDISKGNYSLPYLHSFHRLSPELVTPVHENQKLSKESITYTQNLTLYHIQKSLSSLFILPTSDAKNKLIQMALYLKEKIEKLQKEKFHDLTID